MKRNLVIASAIGTMGFLLVGCGETAESAEANNPRTGSADTSTPSLGTASSTTCGKFKELDTDDERALIEQILAENPGNPLEGSPNVALGTAKLVCLSSSVNDTPVAIATGIVPK
ncbi:hypothetical protein ACL02S_06470 [Nocardia sp. 004]|uniref:hypothetical protein n=1 Tax=Nocardia sp. 004 TaxID=3385978 RepID=UPI0039A3AD97